MLRKHNVDIKKATKYKLTHTVFAEFINEELAEQLCKPMGAKELQEPEKNSSNLAWISK